MSRRLTYENLRTAIDWAREFAERNGWAFPSVERDHEAAASGVAAETREAQIKATHKALHG